ncbi:MAG TPA: hypothetical protein VIX73_16060 [Kofleriaceae bacterium]
MFTDLPTVRTRIACRAHAANGLRNEWRQRLLDASECSHNVKAVRQLARSREEM